MAADQRLAAWRTDPEHAAVLLDFDGTLAQIVSAPEMARPLPGVIEVLEVLAARYGLVAVISGRPAAFLATHLPVAIERWGAYGLERVTPSGRVEIEPAAEPWRAKVAAVVAAARAQAPDGVGVEDKTISVTMHVRNARQHEPWVRAFAASEAAGTGLAVHEAKMSVELRPPLAVDKGTVIERLVADHPVRAVCFVGDDKGDLAAFRALDAVPIGVRVAVRSDESPPELLAAAEIVVDGPAGALRFLRELAEFG